jgi:DNA-directed RNA polymerase subunit RPC12/RpoP
MQLDNVVTVDAVRPAPPVSRTILCPQCGYSGHGFLLVELVPAISAIVPQDGGLLARLDRSELRFDELHYEADRIECPSCRGKFPVPESLKLHFTSRT